VRQLVTVLAAMSTAVALSGCGPRTGTRIEAIGPQTAVVGVELSIMLRTGATGHVDYGFASPDLDFDHRLVRPTLTPYANGEALFRWTPLASDVGDHQLRFRASVGGVPASQVVPVTVLAGADPISFRSPVGEGTTLDLGRTPCAVVPLLVDDTSATVVDISAAGILPNGASIIVDGPLSGQLKFCPSKQLAMAQSIF
jgi:hypothetical protein